MNTAKRKSPSIKFVLKMLVWMLIGGILAFCNELVWRSGGIMWDSFLRWLSGAFSRQ